MSTRADAKLADLFTRRLTASAQARAKLPTLQLSEDMQDRAGERLDWLDKLCKLGKNAATTGGGAVTMTDVPAWLTDDAMFGAMLQSWQSREGLMTTQERNEAVADKIIADAGGNFALARYAIDYCKGDVKLAREMMRREAKAAAVPPQPRSTQPMTTDPAKMFDDAHDDDTTPAVSDATMTAGEAMAVRGLRTSMQARGASPTAIDAAVSRMLANMRAKPQAAA